MPFLRTNIKSSFVSLFFAPIFLLAHGTEQHDTVQNQTIKINTAESNQSEKRDELYSNINRQYLDQIKPIFEKKCFDCHANATKFPWYYSIPGIKQMIDHDIKEAKEHIDMSKDFPFLSHETPFKDLQSLRQIGLKGGMPPLRYILGHWETRLTDDEKKSIIQWTKKSIDILKEANFD